MAGFSFSPVWSFIGSLQRSLWRFWWAFWRSTQWIFYTNPLCAFLRRHIAQAFRAISWRNGGGSPNDPEINDENKPPLRSSSSSGEYEAAAGSEKNEEEDEFDREDYGVDTTDELYCDYDSTWETDQHQQSTLKTTRRQTGATHYKFSRFENAARDMQNYRHDYPIFPYSQLRQHRRNQIGPSNDKPNLKFYLGQRKFSPDGVDIHDFHNKWKGDYMRLERVHTYIQWLFPLQEPGVNYEASTLTKEEIKDFCESSTAKENLLKSYKLMLDFYGIELCDEKTGKVQRASNWRDRFDNLNSQTHNNLRITRILKCLGTLGYREYQYPLVRFFLEETLIHGKLPRVKDSALSYFVFAVLNKRQRRRLIKFAYVNYDHEEEFVWCPKKIQMMWLDDRKEAIAKKMQILSTEKNYKDNKQNLCLTSDNNIDC